MRGQLKQTSKGARIATMRADSRDRMPLDEIRLGAQMWMDLWWQEKTARRLKARAFQWLADWGLFA